MINKKTAYLVFLIVFALSTLTSYWVFSKENSLILNPLVKNKPTEVVNKEESKTEVCPINGAYFSKTNEERWKKRRPLGVMIENHVEARPQSGLSSADVVFEMVAEGGITRFLAIFYCQDAPFIGPIRSARIYFIKLLQGFGENPLYVHVGGANTPGPADALGYIKQIGWSSYNDLNQFSIPFPYFWRDFERLPNRATEHTVYSSTEKLWQYAKDKRGLTNVDEDNVSWDKSYQSWSFKDDQKKELRGKVNNIAFGFWDNLASDFNVIWSYNLEKNLYLRENGGQPHIDKNNNQQISAKNVVIIFADESPANDGYPGGHLLYDIIGKGEALVFQDGKVIKSTWEKSKVEDQIRLYDENDEEINFVRGQIWFEILPIGNKVNY